MKKEKHSVSSVLNDDMADRLVAAAHRDDADIPAASAAFTRNCMSALSGRRSKSASRRLFKVAAASAVLASLATWAMTTALSPAIAQHGKMAPVVVAAVTDPLSFGGDAKGGGCEIVEVYDDHLVVRRQSVAFMRPIGPAWTVPIPARKSGPFDFAVRTESRKVQGAVPQFAAEAKIVAEFCPKGHVLEGVEHKGEPCIHVAFPRARTVKGSRVFDYTVEAIADGMPSPVVSRIVAAGFAYPEECANLPGECLFSALDLPHDRPIRFTVTPRDCFGLAGKPLMNICRDRREPL